MCTSVDRVSEDRPRKSFGSLGHPGLVDKTEILVGKSSARVQNFKMKKKVYNLEDSGVYKEGQMPTKVHSHLKVLSQSKDQDGRNESDEEGGVPRTRSKPSSGSQKP